MILEQQRIVNTRNRMITQNLYMTLNTKKTDRNNNILVIGGSGAGKTFRFVKPQIMQMFGSYIITDPKGEITRDTAGFLKAYDYDVKVLNLLNETEMLKSTRYNPFQYIKSEIDVLKLITNLITNTTPKNSNPNDPFWEKAEAMLLQALFYYVWLEGVPDGLNTCKNKDGTEDIAEILRRIHDPNVKKIKNVRAVMELLKFADFKEDPRTGAKLDSVLDIIMSDLEKRNPEHKAVLFYNKIMRGAADTVRSIIISANARLAPVQSEAVLDLLSEDEIDIEAIGTRKTVVYCIIPDNDKTYNWLVGLFYSQVFQILYYEADFVHGGSLPEHVTFLLDEFANVALPDGFLDLLSTMRSRNISSIIIIQDEARVKVLFKDGQHNAIYANCDTLVYLGSNEADMHKYISEYFGKATIDKRTTGQTLGKQGSSSRNEDRMERSLMLPDEVRKVDGRKCLVVIRGYDPIYDDKIKTQKHPMWKQLCRFSKNYVYDARIERAIRHERAKEQFSTGKFVDYNVLQTLANIDNKKEKDYQHECEVAKYTKEEEPAAPRKHIIDISTKELFQLDKRLSEQNIDMDEHEIDEEIILENLHKAIQRVEDAEKSVADNAYIDTSKFKTTEEALLYARLRKAGFEEKNMKMILRLVQEKNKYTADDILDYFDADMEEDMVKNLVGVLMK